MDKLITVRKEGASSRVITVTDVVPKDWKYVVLEVTKRNKKAISIMVRRVS